ncbi:MAG TPA: M23 family metallopeptidase [Longimicrobium sp.]|nr:M23 family metallopeptidase [Longimicrobium sp.]
MFKLVRRFIPAVLLIAVAAACFGDDSGTSAPPRSDSTSVTITAGGGTLRVDGLAVADFPAGALPAGTRATLQKVTSPEYAADFTLTAGSMYDGVVQAPYQVVIDVAGEQPATNVSVTVAVPAAVRALAPSGSELRVLYTLFQISDDEREETVELLPDRFARTAESATISLPPEAFAGEETDFHSYRAIVYIGYTLTGGPAASAVRYPVYAAADDPDECGAVSLTYPLDQQVTVKRGFGVQRHPITGKVTGHAGIDFPVKSGTDVRAMADGKVKYVRYQYNPKTKTGWGYFMVIQHGPANTLYAHLTEAGRLAEGTVVKAGDVIAQSGASGGVTGPHLHVEYGPNGEYFQKDAKIDPSKCLGRQTNGSISVGDNGPAADDAFRVSLNGTFVCNTAIGETNNCALGRLRTGTYTLTVLCTVAPDNLGTLGITLSNGLKFEDGSTTVSRELDQGESRDFKILAP